MMLTPFADTFLWLTDVGIPDDKLSPDERYAQLVSWASKARGRNPNAFDQLVDWIKEEDNWSTSGLEQSYRYLLQNVMGRFSEQNRLLRTVLSEIAAQHPVDNAVHKALDEFDRVLAGQAEDPAIADAAARMLSNPNAMRDPAVRTLIAGSRTGPTGTDSITQVGYVNYLEMADAALQWALFMPQTVLRQQKGLRVVAFEYLRLPAMRFIGQPEQEMSDITKCGAMFARLDELNAALTELPWDMRLMHHHGRGVDVQPPSALWGRFYPAGTPVPEGFTHLDFVPGDNGRMGVPYVSQAAYARFEGDMKALHDPTGFDVDPMYDITRNIMLGQGVIIPYPTKYWTAGIYPQGFQQPSCAYLFSALVDAS